MSLLLAASTALTHKVATAVVPTAVGDFGPADLFGTFGTQALTVVPWVAAGIAAAIGLYFALIGIRKGLAWFFSVIRKA